MKYLVQCEECNNGYAIEYGYDDIICPTCSGTGYVFVTYDEVRQRIIRLNEEVTELYQQIGDYNEKIGGLWLLIDK